MWKVAYYTRSADENPHSNQAWVLLGLFESFSVVVRVKPDDMLQIQWKCNDREVYKAFNTVYNVFKLNPEKVGSCRGFVIVFLVF